MICPKCKKEHNEWHGKEICFACATNDMIDKTNKVLKSIKKSCKNCKHYVGVPGNSDADGHCNHFGEEVDIIKNCKFYEEK